MRRSDSNKQLYRQLSQIVTNFSLSVTEKFNDFLTLLEVYPLNYAGQFQAYKTSLTEAKKLAHQILAPMNSELEQLQKVLITQLD